jgi:hypothetical protein
MFIYLLSWDSSRFACNNVTDFDGGMRIGYLVDGLLCLVAVVAMGLVEGVHECTSSVSRHYVHVLYRGDSRRMFGNQGGCGAEYKSRGVPWGR